MSKICKSFMVNVTIWLSTPQCYPPQTLGHANPYCGKVLMIQCKQVLNFHKVFVKLHNLQICCIYHQKCFFRAFLLVFVTLKSIHLKRYKNLILIVGENLKIYISGNISIKGNMFYIDRIQQWHSCSDNACGAALMTILMCESDLHLSTL